MGIQKIVKLATSVLTKVQKMPLQHKVGLALGATGGLFGAGVITGYALFGDKFVKQNDEAKLPNPPDAAQENVQEQNAEQKFKYEPPKVGTRGIASVDTTYSAKTGKPDGIVYKDANGDLVHLTLLNENNGDVTSFAMREKFPNGSNIECIYSPDGRLEIEEVNNRDGSSETTHFFEDGFKTEFGYDKEGRIRSYEGFDPTISPYINRRTWEYNDVNGSYVEKNEYQCGDTHYDNIHTYYDKNDRVIKEKQFAKDGQLLFTVTPKYDRDGDIVKRDTTWVNK